MNDAHAVAVPDGINYRSDSFSSLLFRVVLFLDYSVKELQKVSTINWKLYLSSSHKLHDQVQAVALVKDLEQLDDVGVIQLWKDIDLRLEWHLIILFKWVSIVNKMISLCHTSQ